jgi:hypothetical protein
MLYAYAFLLPGYAKLMHHGLTFMFFPINSNSKGFWNWVALRIINGLIPLFFGNRHSLRNRTVFLLTLQINRL